MTPLEIYAYFVIPFGCAAACGGFIGAVWLRKRARKRAAERLPLIMAGTPPIPRMIVDNTTSAA